MTDAASSPATRAGLLGGGLALLVVVLTPVGAALGDGVLLTWLWANTALVALGAALMWTRPAFSLLQLFVPFVATVMLVAMYAARPDVVGWVIPVVHVVALAGIVVGWRRRPAATGGKSSSDVR